ncbi:MAG: PQQ-binding-like beta-propeller repeat protein [Caldisericia bacterium]
MFCSVATDDGIILSKMDVRSGELVWETETEYTNYKPVFSQNGYVVLFDEDSKLVCFDNEGIEVWKTEIIDTQYKYESGISLKIIEDEIFISKYGKESHKEGSIIESNLYAIDIFSGEHVWSKVSDKPITECFAKTSEYTFWGGGKTLYSFGKNGETAWEDYKHCDVVSNTPDNCVKGDYLFFGSFT